MIVELFAGFAILGAFTAALGARSASKAKDRALAELEHRRAADVESSAERLRLNAELGVERAARSMAEAQRDEAVREAAASRVVTIERDRRLSELYAVLENVNAPGGADRVRGMLLAHGRGAGAKARRDPDASR